MPWDRHSISVLILVPSVYVGYTFLLAGSVDKFITNYVEAGYSSSGALVRVSMNLVPALLYLAFRRRFGFDAQQRLFWLGISGASVAAVVALWVISSSTAVDRIALYFIPLQVAVLSRVPSVFGGRERQNMLLVSTLIFYSLSVELVWLEFAEFSYCWVPYRSYLWF